LQGVCVDPNSINVEEGRQYFLFPNGEDHVYASRFQDEKAHFGCFSRKVFRIVQEEEWPPEPTIDHVREIDRERIYRARLIWRRPGYKYKELTEYYLQPKQTHAYFFFDSELKDCGGCFPLHWFDDFQEAGQQQIENELEETPEDNEISKPVQLSFF
jgi:hypothetical protein